MPAEAPPPPHWLVLLPHAGLWCKGIAVLGATEAAIALLGGDPSGQSLDSVLGRLLGPSQQARLILAPGGAAAIPRHVEVRSGPDSPEGFLVVLIDRTFEGCAREALAALGGATLLDDDGMAVWADNAEIDSPIDLTPLAVDHLHPEDLPEAQALLEAVRTRRADRLTTTVRLRRGLRELVGHDHSSGTPAAPIGTGHLASEHPTTASPLPAQAPWMLADASGTRVEGPLLEGVLLNFRELGSAPPPALERLAGLSLADHVPTAVALCDPTGRLFFANSAARSLLDGLEPSGGLPFWSPFASTHHSEIEAALRTTGTGGTTSQVIATSPSLDGSPRWFRLRIRAIGPGGQLTTMAVSIEEVTDLVEARSVRDRLARMLDLSSEVFVAVADPLGVLLYANVALTRLLEERGPGSSIVDLVEPDEQESLMLELWDALNRSGEWRREVTLDSGVRRIDVAVQAQTERTGGGDVGSYLLIAHDITRLKEVEADLRWLASHDLLTGLANRVHLQSVVEDWQLDPTSGPVAALYCDLDRFKEINDTAGHAVGDAVLREVADRIRSCTDAEHVAIRLGGDEFLVLLPRATLERAEMIARRIEHAIAMPIAVDGVEYTVSVAIGIALAPAVEADHLLRQADRAMYQLKRTPER